MHVGTKVSIPSINPHEPSHVVANDKERTEQSEQAPSKAMKRDREKPIPFLTAAETTTRFEERPYAANETFLQYSESAGKERLREM
jgi:hypothetical protein